MRTVRITRLSLPGHGYMANHLDKAHWFYTSYEKVKHTGLAHYNLHRAVGTRGRGQTHAYHKARSNPDPA